MNKKSQIYAQIFLILIVIQIPTYTSQVKESGGLGQQRRVLKQISHIESASEQQLKDFSSTEFLAIGNSDENTVIASSTNIQTSLFYIYSYPIVFFPSLVFQSEEKGIAYNVIVSDNYMNLFVVSEVDGLVIYDISNILKPVKKENLKLGDKHIYATYYEKSNTFAIIDKNEGIQIVTVSTNYNYAFKGEITYSNYSPVSADFSNDGNFLFVLDDYQNQVFIFSLSNLPTQNLVKTINLQHSPFYIEVGIQNAYLAAGEQGVVILDVSNPSTTSILGSVKLPTIANFVTYIEEEDIVIASDLEKGVQIIKWDNIQYPFIINQASTIGKCYQIVKESKTQDFFVASGIAGIQGFRLKFSQQQSVINTLTKNMPYHKVINEVDISNLSDIYLASNGQYLYAISTDGQFYTFDNNNKKQPFLIKELTIGGKPQEIIISISKVYLYITCTDGLAIVNISTPSDPTLTKYQDFTNSGLISAIQKSAKYIIFTQEEIGILIYDISDFNSIQKISSFELEDPRQAVLSSSGSYLYVADRKKGLVVLNLDNIQSPSQVFSNNYQAESIQIFTAKKQIFLGVSYLGLQVYDLTNPESPSIIVQNVTNFDGQQIRNIYVQNSLDEAYIVDNSSGLQILNITDLQNITVLEKINTLGQPIALRTNQNVKYAYIVNKQKGVQVLRLQSPENIAYVFPLDPFQKTNTPDVQSLSGIPIGFNRDALLFLFNFDESESLYYSAIKEYKFLQVKKYTGIKGSQYQFDTLPSWINVNFEFGIISVKTETAPWALGNTFLYTQTSYKIPNNAFLGLTDGESLTIDTLEQSSQILNSLFFYGYIDNESYLTSNYNPQETDFQFYFDPTYETLKNQITQVINENYFVEAIGQLVVINSLDVIDVDSILTLTSNSLKTIRFFIYMHDGEDCIIIPNQELPSTYIQTADFKQIHMAGGTIDLNKSLQKIQIDIDKDSIGNCIADIQVDDQLDEEFNRYNVDLTKYFIVNEAPQLISEEAKLQNQFNEKFSISTPQIGKQYTFQLKQLFEDNGIYNSGDLSYTFQVFDEQGKEDLTQNFISFDELNFNFFIEPKAENMDRKYTIRLIASDGYKVNSDDFVIEIINYAPAVNIELRQQVQPAYINDNFIFQFNDQTFSDFEGDSLRYSIDSKLPSWLEFKEIERKFEGTPKGFQQIDVTVTATDPYGKSVNDQFTIKVQPSFQYYFQILVTYLIPIIGALGFIKYRDELYSICCYRKYEYKRPIEVMVGKKLSYNIPMIKYELQIGFHLYNILLQKKNKNLQQKLLQEQSLTNYFYYFDQISQQVKSNQIISYIQEHPYLSKEENKNTISHIFDGLLNKFRLEKNSVASKLLQELKFYCQQQIIINGNKQQQSKNDWYKEIIILNNNCQQLGYLQYSDYNQVEQVDQLEKELAQLEKIQQEYNQDIKEQNKNKQYRIDQSQDPINVQSLNSPSNQYFTEEKFNLNTLKNQPTDGNLYSDKVGSNQSNNQFSAIKFNRPNDLEIQQKNLQDNQANEYFSQETINYKDDKKTKNRNSIGNTVVKENIIENDNIQKLNDLYQNQTLSKPYLQQQINSNYLLTSKFLSKFPNVQLDEEKIVSILNSILILNQNIKFKLEKYEKNKNSQFKAQKSDQYQKQKEANLTNKQTKAETSENQNDSNNNQKSDDVRQTNSNSLQKTKKSQNQSQIQNSTSKNIQSINRNPKINFKDQDQDALANTTQNNNNNYQNRPVTLSDINEEMTVSVDDFENDMEFIKQLIIQNILLEIRGIKKQKVFYGSRGESLHINSTQLLGVKGSQKVNPKDSQFSKLKSKLSLFKLDYEHLSSSNVNKILPDWVIDTCRFGVIQLYGIPAESDVGEFKLQILDKQNYILKEIWIRVLPPQNEEDKHFQLAKQQKLSNTNIQQAQSKIAHLFQRDKYKKYSFINKNMTSKTLKSNPPRLNQSNLQSQNQSQFEHPSYIKNSDVSIDFLNTDNKQAYQQQQHQFMTPIPKEYTNINPIKKQKFKHLDCNQIFSPDDSYRSQGQINLTQP